MRNDFRAGTLLVMMMALMTACAYDSAGPEYDPVPDSEPVNGMWTVSATVPSILRLAPSQLVTGGSLSPSTRLTTISANLFQANSVAFDTDGTMWIASQDDATLVSFAPAVLVASGARTASVVITATHGSLNSPTALAFDKQHRLWVANSANGTLVRFDREQLAASGAPEPAVVIAGGGRPRGMAFDAAGSLWMSDGLAPRVVKYGTAQLETSGAPVPEVTLGSFDRSLASPTGLAFDEAGNLWVANLGVQSVVAFSPDQQTRSGTSLPHIELSSKFPGASLPVGLAFDAEGSLWVVSADGAILKYDRTIILESGSPLPSVEVTVGGHSLFWSAAFWPRPAGLPLN